MFSLIFHESVYIQYTPTPWSVPSTTLSNIRCAQCAHANIASIQVILSLNRSAELLGDDFSGTGTWKRIPTTTSLNIYKNISWTRNVFQLRKEWVSHPYMIVICQQYVIFTIARMHVLCFSASRIPTRVCSQQNNSAKVCLKVFSGCVKVCLVVAIGVT